MPKLRLLVRRLLPTVASALVVGATACSDLTQASAPDLVQPGDLANATGAVTQYNGAVARFYGAFGAGENAATVASGLLSDELTAAAVGDQNVDPPDLRLLPDGSDSRTYNNLQRARIGQLLALPAVQQFLPEERWRAGRLFANVGYLEALLGELGCSGVPLSSIVDLEPQFGGPLTTAQLYDRALADFDSAQALGADSVPVLYLVQVGRARVLVDLNRLPEAAAAVATVPTAFVSITEHDAASTGANGIFDRTASTLTASVADHDGATGLDFVSGADPRVQTAAVGTGGDGTTTVYIWSKAAAANAPTVLASGVEARLIEAEAELAAGSPSWLATLNDLRATAITPALAPLVDPGTPAARIDLLFRERAFWLFGTAHRLGDLRRLVRQYGRAQNQVFPTGPYKYGGTFGTDVTLPIDGAEISANPMMNGRGCIDRNP